MAHLIRSAVNLAALLALTAPALADEPAAPGGEPVVEATSCLAEAVYFEARGTGERSGEAVAHVVTNRAEDPEFPDTVCDVVADGCQFAYQCDGKPEAMAEPKARATAFRIAREVLSGDAPDPTAGALHFHGEGALPDWAADFERTNKIGGHVFYR